FFEWKRTGREKRPFYFQVDDEMPFAFAGIWDTWSNRGHVVTSCAIITTEANELVAELHDRMPAILKPDSYDLWLEAEISTSHLKYLLSPFPASKMKTHSVSSAVNYPENDSYDLVVQVDAEAGTT